MKPKQIHLFQESLLAWYDKNKRVLDWRCDPTPYHVYLSEIMLQQTRVEAVKEYYRRFISEVPNVEALANIDEDRLLKLWQGLGYYSRARNLKKAAIMMMNKYHGVIPHTYQELITLPGIGPYTAGAIASIAFGEKVAAMDGNVIRIFARVLAIKEEVTNKKVKAIMEETLAALLPDIRVGEFNQALMDLGSAVCIPSTQPRCEVCPLQSICKGYQLQIQGTLPYKAKKKAKKIEEYTVLILTYQNQVAIRQRPNKGLLAKLWEFPNDPGLLTEEEVRNDLSQKGVTPVEVTPLPSASHIFTHKTWKLSGYHVKLPLIKEEWKLTWIRKEELISTYSIPTAFQVYVDYIIKSNH